MSPASRQRCCEVVILLPTGHRKESSQSSRIGVCISSEPKPENCGSSREPRSQRMRSEVRECCLLVLLAASSAMGVEPPDPTSARLAIAPVQARPISFVRDVSPALTKAGCNAGACHGSFQGRGGFRLSLLGFDPDFDHEVLSKASRSRRVVPTAPESSLLLTKPVGEVPHGGGRRITRDSEVFAILRDWQLAGMPGPREGELAGIKLTAQPSDLTLMPNQSQTLTVQATFADGETR